ncbi:hypothetical protein GCM10027592_63370 [Spirosoma flavus]
MKYLTGLFERAERAYLGLRIESIRPDLKGQPFNSLIQAYVSDAVKAFALAEIEYYRQDDEIRSPSNQPVLSELVEQAAKYLATQSAAHYFVEWRIARAHATIDVHEYCKNHLVQVEESESQPDSNRVIEEGGHIIEKQNRFIQELMGLIKGLTNPLARSN